MVALTTIISTLHDECVATSSFAFLAAASLMWVALMCGALRSLISLNYLGEPISLLLLIPHISMLQFVGLPSSCLQA